MSTSTTVVLSVLGLSLGLLLSGLIFPDSRPWSIEVLLLSIACTVLLLTTFALVARRFQPPLPERGIVELVRLGESHLVEFKSSARWNLHTKQRDERLELVIAKTITGFMNADGGTLLIGVSDEGQILGLEKDLSVMQRPDVDRYELWLRDMLSTRLGQNAATLPLIDFTPTVVDHTPTFICRVSCPSSPVPVYLNAGRNERAEFWVRTGNSTRQLGLEETAEYVMLRWPLGIGRTMAAQLRAAVRGNGVGADVRTARGVRKMTKAKTVATQPRH
ncbi:helix-turn-helix domain-containing protein [Microbacterium sp. NPDC056052]|uniref:AlbA family DNA-binding domain-containing protein n=1 Tax=Microbacterium sp. NPDC056052 TaxID=3345695 RepID=UPI0035E1A225